MPQDDRQNEPSPQNAGPQSAGRVLGPADQSGASGSTGSHGLAGGTAATISHAVLAALRLALRVGKGVGLALLRLWRWLTPAMRKAVIALGVVAALVVAFWDDVDLPYHWMDAKLGRRPLLAAKSWHYQLTNFNLAELAKNDADVFVIDYATDGGKNPITAEQVAKLKVKPDGKPRIVVSYLSIGEAEVWRWYWRPEWTPEDMPGWHVAENCAWPGGHMVRFWHDGWRDIVYRAKRSYLKRIIEAGFDGIFLDRVDVWEQLVNERPTARADMIEFVKELAAYARSIKPGFLVIPQNAEALLLDRSYRNAIDALGKEELLYSTQVTGQRNPEKSIAWSKERIGHLLRVYKPVFAVEYMVTPEGVANATKELRSLGIVPTVQHRSLDSTDPTDSTPRKAEVHGTPEWIKEKCKDKRWW